MIGILKNIYRNLRVYYWNFKVLAAANRRRRISIFDYEKLALPFNIKYHSFSMFDFNYYGIGICLRNKFDLNKSSVEHGIVFGSFVQPHLITDPYFEKIYTLSDYRENRIKDKNSMIKIVKTGPYIAYADRLFTEDYFSRLKNGLGKVLLVFPEHTLMEMDFHYEIEQFIERIKLKGAQYDTIMICGYWADILKGNLDLYKKCGFKVVCAGHNLDPYFLSRLRFILELSDTVLTNGVGTHIGYSIYLQRHTIVLKQEFHRFLLDKNSNELSARSPQDHITLEEDRDRIYEIFSNSYKEEFNTDDQIQYISKLFGFQYVKK